MDYHFSNKTLAAALLDAFQVEPFYLGIAKARNNQSESIARVLLKYFDFSIQEGKKYGTTFTLANPAIGASIWHRPATMAIHQQQAKEKKEFLKNYLGEGSLAFYEKIASNMAKKEEQLIEAHYWYLSILGVTKAYQGQGMGRQLVAPVLAKIDQFGVPSFLETFTEGNLIFYGKLGFEVVAEYWEPLVNKTCWILVRPPI